jgi:hypothetical protein
LAGSEGRLTDLEPVPDDSTPGSEADLQHAIRLDLGTEPGLTLFRNETGVAKHQLRHRTGHVRYGLCKGSADLIGILAPPGRFIALEIKTRTGKPTSEQTQFLELIRKRGGFACVVRSVQEAREAIARARKGHSE